MVGWDEGMHALLGESTTTSATLQQDNSECGVWVALLAHMVTCVRSGQAAQGAVDTVASLCRHVGLYMAMMSDVVNKAE